MDRGEAWGQSGHGEAPVPALSSAFVSWVPVCGRSQGFIDALHLTPITVSYLGTEKPLLAPLKYGPQALRTLQRLMQTRPRIVFVMDPPPVAVGMVFLYCIAARARYIMDCHSGVFEGRRWRWSLPLQRFFGRRAAAVIVTNPAHAAAVRRWPARPLIMGDPPPAMLRQPDGGAATPERAPEPVVFVVARFGDDEAIPETLEAARHLPQVRFDISGDIRRARPAWVSGRPPNVRFTGWLPLADFWAAVTRASLILTLTTRENTILRGGWEAMFAGQPLVTSNTRTLRGYFTRGAVFADPTAAGIAAAVGQALAREPELSQEMKALQREKALTWQEERSALERLLGVTFAGREGSAA